MSSYNLVAKNLIKSQQFNKEQGQHRFNHGRVQNVLEHRGVKKFERQLYFWMQIKGNVHFKLDT